VKRDAHGRIDLISPFPVPFNYGRIEGMMGGDGEPLDVVILGPRHKRGTRLELPVQGIVRFVDGSKPDDKWVCAHRPLSKVDVALVTFFFRAYAVAKRTRDRLHGHPATSRFAGLHSVTLS
jgi:inorganic pyrophosphatase